ncbi:thioester reductase domain-containing protein, partial [Streptomyces sp. URMC 126]|uniref:thioester reductase domain-containing protein n=1 Tax=Streptomyces sp. URMC 126 TaxID=3423401 RepID=UPI003F1B0B26
ATPAAAPEPRPAVADTAPAAAPDAELTPTEREIAAVWREVLGLREIDPDEDFFEAGGHSLRAVRVLLRLRERLGVDLPVQVFFEARTVSALAAVFDRARGAAPEPPAEDDDLATLTADAVLDPDVTPADSAPHDPRRTAAPEHILLTGATSFLGAHLLARLLDRTTARVHCLVEADDPAEAAGALERALARYGVTVPWERVTPLPGSLREPRLGLSPIAFARLAATVDVIHHAGCDANLALPYAELRAANVGGTTEVLRLAARDRVKAVHYVSSPGVLLDRDAEPGILAPDGRVPADRVLPSGYVRSRWAAEERVDAARERGIPVSVYRPGRLGGDSTTGAGDPDSAFGRFLAACVRLGTVPAYGPDADFDLVPVDYATAALAELSLKPAALGGTYHLAHPVRTRFAAVVERLRAAGHPLTETDPEEWTRAVTADLLEAGGDADESVASVAALAGASRGMPGFGSLRLDVTGTLRALAGAVPCPPPDGPALDRYLDHLTAAGPLPPAAGSRTPGSEIVI